MADQSPTDTKQGSMHWLRWWHGTVTDPKLQRVARISGQPVGAVIAVWACLLEHASNVTHCNADVTRGSVSGFDCNDHDVLLGYEDGAVQKIYDALVERGVIVNEAIASWEKRQPKREDSSAARVREHRARKKEAEIQAKIDALMAENEALKRNVTHGNAKSKIENKNNKTLNPCSPGAEQAGAKPGEQISELHPFEAFYLAYPRKQGKQRAIKAWGKLKPDAELIAQIMAAVEAQKAGWDWQRDNGQYIPHPASWLNGGCWMDEVRQAPAAKPANGGAWWVSIETMRAKGREFNPPIVDRPGETIVAFKNRIDEAIANGGVAPVAAAPAPYVPPMPTGGESQLTPEQKAARSEALRAMLKRGNNISATTD